MLFNLFCFCSLETLHGLGIWNRGACKWTSYNRWVWVKAWASSWRNCSEMGLRNVSIHQKPWGKTNGMNQSQKLSPSSCFLSGVCIGWAQFAVLELSQGLHVQSHSWKSQMGSKIWTVNTFVANRNTFADGMQSHICSAVAYVRPIALHTGNKQVKWQKWFKVCTKCCSWLQFILGKIQCLCHALLEWLL